MKKRIILLLAVAFIVSNSNAQKKELKYHDIGIYTSFDWSAEESVVVIPQTWMYINDYYIEARYNYEDQKTVSLYFGKAFTIDKIAEYEITPMIGVVVGKTNGISPGLNFQLEYKRFSTFTQCQYTFDFNRSANSFFWNWSGFDISISKYIGVGGSVQVFEPNKGNGVYRAGPMLSFRQNSFSIEAYVYNFWQQKPIYSIGFEYQFK